MYISPYEVNPSRCTNLSIIFSLYRKALITLVQVRPTVNHGDGSETVQGDIISHEGKIKKQRVDDRNVV